jgi:hypothetical protein
MIVCDENQTPLVPAGEEIVFPNVDTCCAFVFLMADGSAVGGHATQWFNDGINKRESADDMLARMVTAGGVPSQILYVGQADWKTDASLAQAANRQLKDCQAANLCRFYDTVDVFVDLGARRLQVQAKNKSEQRDFGAAPLKRNDWLYDQPLPTLTKTVQGPMFCVIF